MPHFDLDSWHGKGISETLHQSGTTLGMKCPFTRGWFWCNRMEGHGHGDRRGHRESCPL